MGTPRAKTLQERFGFFDEELKTPGHDALMFWIDDNASEILCEVFELTEEPKIFEKHWEKPIKTERDFLLGSADMLIRAESRRKGTLAVFIEAKVSIRSLSELLRQVNFYKEGGHYADYSSHQWMVVSPDDRFAVKIREQKTLFFKSPTLQSIQNQVPDDSAPPSPP